MGLYETISSMTPWISIISVIGALIVPILIYRWQKKVKSLTYSIVETTELFNINDEIRDKLKILYEEKPVESLHLIVLKIRNKGNIPIDETDFKSNLVFEFNEEAVIVSLSDTIVSPESLDWPLVSINNTLTLFPTLLNQGDLITVKLLVSGFKEITHIDGRIFGVKEIKEEGKSKNVTVALIGAFFSLLLLSYSITETISDILDGINLFVALSGHIFYFILGYLLLLFVSNHLNEFEIVTTSKTEK